MKKKKKIINKRLVNLQTKVTNNLNKLSDFDLNIKLNDVKTNSCFDFKKGKLNFTFDFTHVLTIIIKIYLNINLKLLI
jgi:hypothetical protein